MEALKDLLYKMADDLLILGHRNSEWTGIGPLLEEDIAFSSMAQDKLGQSLALYQLLNNLGESDPDTLAFSRTATLFHNCTLVELPIGEYDFSLARHFLFDHSELLRYEMLSNSSYKPLALIAVKFHGEIRYHTLHANTWVKQLGNATEESISRMQAAFDFAFPYALAIFEPSKFENELIATGIFEGEEKLKEKWIASVSGVLHQTEIKMPDLSKIQSLSGGRYGIHTEHLQPLLDEMSEVVAIDPAAEW